MFIKEVEELCHWWEGGDMNKSIEREAFIDTVGMKSAELKDKFLFEGFTAFCVSLV